MRLYILISKMNTYKTLKILPHTHTELKVYAAKNKLSMGKAIDLLLKRGVKGENSKS